MTKLDWMLAENHRIMDEQQHRTEVENEAFELMAQGKFDEARELVETLDDSLLEFREWPGEEEKEQIEAADCIVQHFNAFMNQARNGQKADFGQPCKECIYRKECKFDWLSKIQPVLELSNIKISLARTKH